MSDDLISRRLALDALCDDCSRVQSVCPHYPCREYTKIEALPSAQPEILACGEGELNVPGTNVGDMIGRHEAIDAVRRLQTYKLFEGDDMLLVDKAEVQTELMMLPSAEPEPRWIPVTERLPDLGISVLLNEGYSYAVGYLLKTTEGKYEWGVNGWYNDLEDWSAWMPLPAPWKGEADGHD